MTSYNSLNNIPNVALSGMNASKLLLNNSILNTASALDENYTRRDVQLGTQYAAGTAYGVKVDKVTRVADPKVLTAIINQNSILASAKAYQYYNDEIQVLLGTPNNGNSITDVSKKFFKAVNDLSAKPEFVSLRFVAVREAANLANTISNFANNLNYLRVQADQDLYNGVQEANRLINKIALCNENFSIVKKNSGDTLPILDEREATIKKLAELIPVRTFEQENGQISIFTTQGLTVINGKFKYLLDYSPALDISNFTENLPLSPLNLVPTFTENPLAKPIPLMSSGVSVAQSAATFGQIILTNSKNLPMTTVNNILDTCRLTALQDIRDNDIPTTLGQLDMLAQTMRDTVNKIHNTGVGMPGTNILTGTNNIAATDIRKFAGNIRIAVLDQNGNPPISQDNMPYPPLTLNLAELNSGIGAGNLSMKTIIDEINQYFCDDAVTTHTTLGNLYDIRIAATSNIINVNGNFSFDFELVNRDYCNSLFQVNNVVVYDANNIVVTNALTSSLPDDFLIDANTRTRTGNNINVSLAGTGGPYTIESSVSVLNQVTGKIDNAILNFVINDTLTDNYIINNRYRVNSVQSGDATIIAASTTQNLLQANIIDSDGMILDNSAAGYVNITTKNPNYFIAIDDLDSQELGFNSINYIYPATNRGLSHFLGLNNLFVDSYKTSNASGNLTVREDILENPNLLSVGKMLSSPAYPTAVSVGITNATINLLFSGNLPSSGDSVTINGTVMNFVTNITADNQILIGANWTQTLNNIVSALNTKNATTKNTIDQANYSIGTNNSLNISYKFPGLIGNNFIINSNFVNTSTSINGADPVSNFTTSLVNGQEQIQPVFITPPTYQISVGSADCIEQIAKAGIDNVVFQASNGLPAISTNFINYSAAIISTRSTNASQAKLQYKQQDDFANNLQKKFRSVSGVNIDEEAENAQIYILSSQANMKAFEAVSKLYEMLFRIAG